MPPRPTTATALGAATGALNTVVGRALARSVEGTVAAACASDPSARRLASKSRLTRRVSATVTISRTRQLDHRPTPFGSARDARAGVSEIAAAAPRLARSAAL